MELHTLIRATLAGIPALGFICWLFSASTGDVRGAPDTARLSQKSVTAEIRRPSIRLTLTQGDNDEEWASDVPLVIGTTGSIKRNHREGYEKTDEQSPIRRGRQIWRF